MLGLLFYIRLSSRGHIAQDDFCFTLSTEVSGDENGNQVHNEKLKSHKAKAVILDLCIDEGENQLQLWERYRPPREVRI